MRFNKEVFAANLRAARAALDMSQEELAKAVGVSKPTLKPVVLEVVLRTHEPCGLDAAQRQFYRAIVVLVIAWWQRRKMPARSGNFERARQIAGRN